MSSMCNVEKRALIKYANSESPYWQVHVVLHNAFIYSYDPDCVHQMAFRSIPLFESSKGLFNQV